MPDKTIQLYGQPVFLCADDGPKLRTDGEAVDVIANALEQEAILVVLPVARLDPGFFDLSSGIAGQILQKFVQYRSKLVILGDISAYLADSEALQALVRESNRGRHAWFEPDLPALETRLAQAGFSAVGGGPRSGR
jgi:hypothetical protein